MTLPNGHLLDHVDDYLHGLLSPEDAQSLEHHVQECSLCREALDAARRRAALLRSLPPVKAPPELVPDTLDRIASRGVRRERSWWWLSRGLALAAAASMLAIASLQGYYASLRPSPYDLRILGQSRWLPEGAATLRVALFDRRSGAPLPGASGNVMLQSGERQVRLASFQTSATGEAHPRFTLPDWPDGPCQLIVTATNPSGGEEKLHSTVTLRRAWKLMLSSDKPIYRPGDTIHLRALALRRPDLLPQVGQPATFTIHDGGGNLIFRKSDLTSQFGLASADCPLATELNEGEFKLTCQVGATSSERTVRVERYVLPKFRVGVTLDRPYYEPQSLVHGTVDAKYFFGEPVANGTVEVRALTVDVGESEFHRATLRTDKAGRVDFSFRLPSSLVGRETEQGAATIRIEALIIDPAGQRAIGTARRLVGRETLRVTAVPETSPLVPGIPNRLFLLVEDISGRPLEAEVILSRAEPEIDAPPTIVHTDSSGLASVELTPIGEQLDVVAKATDREGRSRTVSIRQPVGALATTFLLRTDRASYASGDTMTLTAFGGGVAPLFVDLLKDGQSVLATTIPMADGEGELEIDLPPDVFGTLQCVAYRFGAEGLPVRQSRVIPVRRADALGVTATLDREQYEPGGRAVVTFRLSGPDGAPVPGAISVAAVDEAVYSVLGPQLGLERAFFELEQRLLQPVATPYSWSPFDEGADDRELRARMLLAGASSASAGDDAIPDAFTAGARPGFSASADALADGETPVFSLAGATFPVERAAVDFRKQRGARWVARLWRGWGGLAILAAVGLFALYRPRAFLISAAVAAVLGALLMSTLMLASRSLLSESAKTAAGDAAMPTSEAPDGHPAGEEGEPSDSARPRVREWFPETLVWRPELVTDESGVATLMIDPLADSITTWRLSASAIDAQGRLGAVEQGIRVFQPFFVDLDLPVAFTRHDQASLPIVVHNYLDEPQQVELTLAGGDWFELASPPSPPVEETDGGDATTTTTAGTWTLELGPREQRAVSVPLRFVRVGRHTLEVTARAGGVADAIRREVEVVANGTRVERVENGLLDRPVTVNLEIPHDVIPSSPLVLLKLHASPLSQVVEGVEAMFAAPHGCFEQTSSTTYPNVLALDYLRRTKRNLPEVELQAQQFIHLGYQRLISFEVPGGGFEWFGHPPAHPLLTAYGLMEFEDMAVVHDVDPRLIERTRAWLRSRRSSDGGWDPAPGLDAAGNEDRLRTTAYIAQAVYRSGVADQESLSTLRRIGSVASETCDDPYLAALQALALSGLGDDPAAQRWVERLLSLKRSDGERVWWELPESVSTCFHGTGQAGAQETTAWAALALMQTGRSDATLRAALRWIVEQKSGTGAWLSTQATVLSLRALLEAEGRVAADSEPRQFELRVAGNLVRTLDVAADQSDVVQQLDLTPLLDGPTAVELRETTGRGASFQLLTRYHTEAASDEPRGPGGLRIEARYDKTHLSVDDQVIVEVTVANDSSELAPMVMVDLPIPPGFSIDPGELDELIGSKTIARYELTPRQAIVYLRGLAPGQSLPLRYRLRATMPVRVTAPPVEAYLYYSPDQRAKGAEAILEAE